LLLTTLQISVQMGHICYSFAYQDYDKPYYRNGNTKLLAVNVLSIALFLATKVYYIWRNKQKDQIWNSMTEEEKAEYIRFSTDKGCKRLDFRFAH